MWWLVPTLLACFSPTETATPPAEPAPDAVVKARQLLAWAWLDDGQQVDGAAPRTRWIEIIGDTPEERGAWDGLVVATSDGPRRLTIQRRAVQLQSCNDAEMDASRFLSLGLDRLDGSPAWLDTLEPPEGEALTGTWQEALHVDGVVGPYAFLHAVAETYTCGAHGNTLHEATVLDLRTGAEVDLLDDPAVRAVLPEARQAAFDTLVAAGAEDEQAMVDATSADALEPVRILPSWADGRLSLTVQWTASACFACSDGAWSSYTRSTTTPLPAIPARLKAHASREPLDVVLSDVDAWQPLDARDHRLRDALEASLEE